MPYPDLATELSHLHDDDTFGVGFITRALEHSPKRRAVIVESMVRDAMTQRARQAKRA
jgi:hypothetical protein